MNRYDDDEDTFDSALGGTRPTGAAGASAEDALKALKKKKKAKKALLLGKLKGKAHQVGSVAALLRKLAPYDPMSPDGRWNPMGWSLPSRAPEAQKKLLRRIVRAAMPSLLRSLFTARPKNLHRDRES